MNELFIIIPKVFKILRNFNAHSPLITISLVVKH